jgi:hypothetical protein
MAVNSVIAMLSFHQFGNKLSSRIQLGFPSIYSNPANDRLDRSSLVSTRVVIVPSHKLSSSAFHLGHSSPNKRSTTIHFIFTRQETHQQLEVSKLILVLLFSS